MAHRGLMNKKRANVSDGVFYAEINEVSAIHTLNDKRGFWF